MKKILYKSLIVPALLFNLNANASEDGEGTGAKLPSRAVPAKDTVGELPDMSRRRAAASHRSKRSATTARTKNLRNLKSHLESLGNMLGIELTEEEKAEMPRTATIVEMVNEIRRLKRTAGEVERYQSIIDEKEESLARLSALMAEAREERSKAEIEEEISRRTGAYEDRAREAEEKLAEMEATRAAEIEAAVQEERQKFEFARPGILRELVAEAQPKAGRMADMASPGADRAARMTVRMRRLIDENAELRKQLAESQRHGSARKPMTPSRLGRLEAAGGTLDSPTAIYLGAAMADGRLTDRQSAKKKPPRVPRSWTAGTGGVAERPRGTEEYSDNEGDA